MMLYNSNSLKNEVFEPFNKGLVRIFICGPTIYDYTHVGHARIFLTYDLLCRHLRERGYFTDVLVNMTDINQNVFNKAKSDFKDFHAVARLYASKFMDDLVLLNIHSITRLAFVSDYVSQIENHVSKLLDDKFAYSANGNIYLDISKVPYYGQLSKQSPDNLLLHRLDIGPNKRSQGDIMLWNCSEDFDYTWKSRLGEGIPWWHMQDTTVALENFGTNYDIHGGARELLYPHHEAHLAQYKMFSSSENPVKIWMHVGLVLSKGEKMSKSLGNVVWSKDMVNNHHQNLLRIYLFSKHYREDINFNEEEMVKAKPFLDMICLTGLKTSDKTDPEISKIIYQFFSSLDNDLDSPKALELFYDICTRTISGSSLSLSDFNRICLVLGLEV